MDLPPNLYFNFDEGKKKEDTDLARIQLGPQ